MKCRAVLVPSMLALAAGSAHAQCVGSWSLGNTGPSPRQNHAMVYDSDRQVIVLFGGYRGGVGFNNETWEYDGISWSQVFASGPLPRGNFGMAYDSARHKTVLFGGAIVGGAAVGDTWEYDGASGTWSEMFPVNTPTSRYNHQMTFDSTRGRTIMFGGFGATRYGDTWAWDGSDWSLLSTTGCTPRSSHAMTYDASRDRVVVFGGFNGSRLSDTWEWNGTAWSQIAAPGPSGRQYLAMDYDTRRHTVMLLAGQTGACGDCRESDTWIYDGAVPAWTLVNPSGTGPTPIRDQHFLTYHSAIDRFIAFGGYAGNGNVLSDTWIWTPGADVEIDDQPDDASASLGGTVQFSIVGGETGPFTYQWFHNGSAISNGGSYSGVDTETLTIDPVASEHAGTYRVLVRNSCDQLFSDEATLTIGCAADFNGDNQVDFFDYLDFAQAFDAEDPAADFNGDNQVDFFDYLDFAQAFDAGC